MILSFMDDKFVDELIQDSARKKAAKSVVLNLLTRRKLRNIEKGKVVVSVKRC